MVWVFFVAGLVLLVLGAEALVRGASRLASSLGVPPLVIGLTVVAYGTSTPEVAVSVQAALAGQADITIGNVVGSNIFNVLFILGLSAMIAPLIVSRKLVQIDVPLMVGVSALMLVMALDGRISRLDGAILAALVFIYTAFLVRQARKERTASREAATAAEGENAVPAPGPTARMWAVNLVYIAAGLGLLVLGSGWFVESSMAIARMMGVSELVIGLTIVAAGTSMPEVATSIIASIRGERDIAVGNLVGSNIYNILAVLGFAALLSPGGVGVAQAALDFDIPVMMAVAVACLPIFFTGHLIARWEGWLFFGYYVAYTLFLTLASQRHDALPALSLVMEVFVIPLTVITLIVLAVRARRQHH
ncbi:MAG TPA: calcium/sodium antiporter [Vicinamibacterales bacterium]|nr:calcium/sodium antiporter [Vicinamibacterales bacterium]